ncbi:MAG: hypothetical protein ABIQ12_13415 [Opitutaceae bacterium]
MRKSLLPILSLVLATSLASLASAQPARAKTSDQTAGPGEFLLYWTYSDSSEIEIATKRLDLAKQRFEAGNLSQEELDESRIVMERIYKNVPRLLTIRSGGGPLSAFLAAASKDHERTINLINAGDAADLETPLPPFVLRNVTWGTVLSVLDNFLQPRGLNLRFVGGDHPDPNHAKSVVCVLRHAENSPDANRPPQPVFESFQLGEFITAEQTVDAIVDAIRTAWELDPAHDAAALRVKFHPATKLLLVSGPGPAAGIAKQVVARLRNSPVQR